MSGYQKGVITKAKTKSEKRDYGNSSGQKRPKTKKKKKDKGRKPNNEITNHTCYVYVAINL